MTDKPMTEEEWNALKANIGLFKLVLSPAGHTKFDEMNEEITQYCNEMGLEFNDQKNDFFCGHGTDPDYDECDLYALLELAADNEDEMNKK